MKNIRVLLVFLMFVCSSAFADFLGLHFFGTDTGIPSEDLAHRSQVADDWIVKKINKIDSSEKGRADMAKDVFAYTIPKGKNYISLVYESETIHERTEETKYASDEKLTDAELFVIIKLKKKGKVVCLVLHDRKVYFNDTGYPGFYWEILPGQSDAELQEFTGQNILDLVNGAEVNGFSLADPNDEIDDMVPENSTESISSSTAAEENDVLAE